MTESDRLIIIGGGLAGCEAAWQAAKAGCMVELYEMKPHHFSPAHESSFLAELVCSNSFRSDDPHSAVGLLKEEMTRLGSLVMEAARATAVPAGKALAVDRELFARTISEAMENNPFIDVRREEINALPDTTTSPYILATGPLTAESMADSLSRFTGKQRLFFYDAIAPIIESESLDRHIVYEKSRYDEGPGDYLNCPMDKEHYMRFIDALAGGNSVPLHSFEKVKYFEGCLPIEVMCERGPETLRYGPMKPVGLPDPRTGREPYAVVQLRKENLQGTHYNMVGFQTKLSYPEQKRIFTLIPGMERAVFSRYGSIHRNTFICAPELLMPTLQMRTHPNLLIAGQLSGVEGYIESAAMGLLAGINGSRIAKGISPLTPPPATALGALVRHLTATEADRFQPSNINFGLFPPLGRKIPKRQRGAARAELARIDMGKWIDQEGLSAEAQDS